MHSTHNGTNIAHGTQFRAQRAASSTAIEVVHKRYGAEERERGMVHKRERGADSRVG